MRGARDATSVPTRVADSRCPTSTIPCRRRRRHAASGVARMIETAVILSAREPSAECVADVRSTFNRSGECTDGASLASCGSSSGGRRAERACASSRTAGSSRSTPARPPLHLSRARLGRPAGVGHVRAARGRRSRGMAVWSAGCYRPAIVVFVIGFAWIELIDVTTYLNHYWFVTPLGLVMPVAPMDARFAARRRTSAVVPSRLGVAGAHPDRGRRLRVRRARQAHTPTGSCTRSRCGSGCRRGRTCRSSARCSSSPGPRYALSWAGAAFDCSVVALLLLAPHPSRGVGGRGRVPRRDVAPVPDRRVPVADDRRHDGLLRARLAASPRDVCAAGRGRSAPVGDGALTHRRSTRPWRRGRRAVGAGDRRDPAPASCDPGRRPVDERGLPVLVGRAAHREGRRRQLPGHRAATGTMDRDRDDLYTPTQWRAMATEPELIRQAAHASPPSTRRRPPRRGAGRCVRLAQRPARAPPRRPDVDLTREPYRLLGQPWILPGPRATRPDVP